MNDTDGDLQTENETLRRRLEEAENNLRAVFEQTYVGIAETDTQGCFIRVNERFCEIAGFARAELLAGMCWRDIIHPEDLPGYLQSFAGAATEGVSFEIEKRCLRKDGSIVWVHDSVSAVIDSGGNVRSLTSMVIDVSERKRADEERDKFVSDRKKAEEQLAKTAATVPGVICTFRLRPDGSASMPYASPAFEALYGLRREEVVEDFTPVFDRVHPDDIRHIHATIAESARTMAPWRDTFRYRHPSKGEIWIEGHSMPQREPDGSIFWHGYIQDITERKQKEGEIALLNQSLKHRVEEMQTVFETAPIGLAIAEDTEGLHIRGNPANERLLGLPPGAELSWRAPQPAAIRFFRDGLELSVDELPMQRAVRGETVSGQIMEMVRQDGQASTLIANAAPLFDEQGHPRGAVGAFLEITALKMAVQTLRDSEHFKQAVLDALPASIAVLDRQGVILSVNQPWLRFAAENEEPDASKVGIGVNYLNVCRSTPRDGNGYAESALKGIEDVLSGLQTYFELEYPCHSKEMERWFLMQVVRPSDKVGGAIVIHLDISERRRAQAEIERHVHSLLAANEELARFNRVAVGRELRMIELKKQVNELCALAGQPPRYRVDFDLPSPPASIE